MTKSAEFLLLEFDVLHRRIDLTERKKAERSTIFAGAAGVFFAATAASDHRALGVIRSAAFVALLLGATIFWQNALASVQVVLLYRRAGRIRCYFDDADPNLKSYLPWASGDNTPPFKDSIAYSTYERSDVLVGAVNSAMAAAVCWLSWSDIWGVLGGLGLAALVIIIQLLATRWIRQRAEREASLPYNVHFPYQSRTGSLDELHGHH